MMTRVFIGDSHHTHVCVNFQHRRRTFRNMGLLCDIEVYYNLFFRLLLPRESQNRSEKKIVLGLYASVIFLLEEGGRGFRVSLLTLLTRDFRDCNHDCATFYTKKNCLYFKSVRNFFVFAHQSYTGRRRFCQLIFLLEFLVTKSTLVSL